MDTKELTSWTTFGERGSGTRWVSSLLNKATLCVNLTDSYVSGWKHGLWTPRAATNLGKHNLVVVVQKDIFAWLISLHQKPWHCQHLVEGKSFSEFIRGEYYSVVDETKHSKWWGLEPGDELPERLDGKRWANPIQMWRDKQESFIAMHESKTHPSILIDYMALLSNPKVLLHAAEKLGVKIVDWEVPNPKKGYQKFHYYTDHLYMELYKENDIKFIQEEFAKPLDLYPALAPKKEPKRDPQTGPREKPKP